MRFFIPRKRKAGQLLEFTLLLPMAMLIIVFSIDMGRLILASTSLHASVSTAARAGARVGFAGDIPVPANCQGYSGSEAPAYSAFCESADIDGGAVVESVEILTPVGGGLRFCVAGSDGTQYVTVKAKARIDFITPGLATMLGVNTGESSTFSATGSARCEVTR
ncbi:MAG: TadE/TadG family type IV pilus assembly protein [Candidatus Paceibacterota bacterium]